MSTTAPLDISIRPATPDDCAAIMVLENSCFDSVHERFHSRQVLDLIANPRATVIVAQAGTGTAKNSEPFPLQGLAPAPVVVRRCLSRRTPGTGTAESAEPVPSIIVPGAVLGWGAALVRKNRSGCTGRIYAVAVAPGARGLKLGRRLMEHLLESLRGRGASKVFLEVRSDNLPAISLYRKLGFVERHTVSDYYSPGRHALKMELSWG